MLALGTQTQRPGPGGPNYLVPHMYVKVCQGKGLCRCLMVAICIYLMLLYTSIQLPSQGQGHLHYHPVSHAHSLCLLCRVIQERTIRWDKFIRQLSASTVIYHTIYPRDVFLSFSFLIFLCLSPSPSSFYPSHTFMLRAYMFWIVSVHHYKH